MAGNSALNIHSHNTKSVIPELLSENELATLLQVSVSWCQRARHRGDGPPFIKIKRTVRYRNSVVNEWLNDLPSHLSTSDYKEQTRGSR